jgi:hypothetical protein
MSAEQQVMSFKNPLVLDVSSPCVQAGIASETGWRKIIACPAPPMQGVFESVTKLTRELKISASEIDAVFFCAGPGSTLGLRLALAFVKTLQWQRKNDLQLFSYNALDLANQMMDPPPHTLQAPFRMGWRIIRTAPDGKPIGEKEILETEEALKKFPSSIHLEDQRKNSSGPLTQNILQYELEKVRGLCALLSVSEITEELTIYSPRPPEFKKWIPQIQFLSPDG